jgi:hypothetical protein
MVGQRGEKRRKGKRDGRGRGIKREWKEEGTGRWKEGRKVEEEEGGMEGGKKKEKWRRIRGREERGKELRNETKPRYLCNHLRLSIC